jgi:hypothetical protein
MIRRLCDRKFSNALPHHRTIFGPPPPSSSSPFSENSYKTFNYNGQQLFYAQEESSVLCRCVCKNNRAFKLHITNDDGSVFLEIERPLRLYYQALIVRDENGMAMGQIERKFTWFSRDFTVSGPEGQPLFNIHGPFFRAWTFEISALVWCLFYLIRLSSRVLMFSTIAGLKPACQGCDHIAASFRDPIYSKPRDPIYSMPLRSSFSYDIAPSFVGPQP